MTLPELQMAMAWDSGLHSSAKRESERRANDSNVQRVLREGVAFQAWDRLVASTGGKSGS